MKKFLLVCVAAFAVMGVMAQEAQDEVAPAQAPSEKTSWPLWLSFNTSDAPDITGLHLTLPYGTVDSVTGFDIGIYSHVRYMEGLQTNLLRNDAIDQLAGIQVGIYNTAGRADLFGIQLGLFNEVQTIRGAQGGIVNVANAVYGFQVGIVNRAETMYGFQVGIVNIIRESELPFCPIVNIGLNEYTRF
ncbi:MAG: hypothetical protein IJ802_06015 [Kiritimatiellae bacterium]|nr:hypothetical protein [Kiritimatiellia bacterium]